MAVNLIGVIMQYLTPNRIGRIAAAFNLDSKSAQSVAELSVPSLLAGLASVRLNSCPRSTGGPTGGSGARGDARHIDVPGAFSFQHEAAWLGRRP